MARKTLAVASQRSVRRISSGLKVTCFLQRDRGRRCNANGEGKCKRVPNGYYDFRQPIEQAEVTEQLDWAGGARLAYAKLGGITAVTLHRKLDRLKPPQDG